MTYVCSGVLLFRAGHSTTSLCSVECALALDGRLALSSPWSADLAADLGDTVPVVAHIGWEYVVWWLIGAKEVAVCARAFERFGWVIQVVCVEGEVTDVAVRTKGLLFAMRAKSACLKRSPKGGDVIVLAGLSLRCD